MSGYWIRGVLWRLAAHADWVQSGSYPPVPAVRHMHEYAGLKAPRTPNFNPPDGEHKKPSWVGKLPVMDGKQIEFSDVTHRARAQSMLGLDEMFNELLDILEEAGELDNTYGMSSKLAQGDEEKLISAVIMSSDHGYHLGQHRIPAGKTLPYKEDTNVPFVIRGPGIPKGNLSYFPFMIFILTLSIRPNLTPFYPCRHCPNPARHCPSPRLRAPFFPGWPLPFVLHPLHPPLPDPGSHQH